MREAGASRIARPNEVCPILPNGLTEFVLPFNVSPVARKRIAQEVEFLAMTGAVLRSLTAIGPL
jgi:hypothetical protein